jgi:hypothetical protein
MVSTGRNLVLRELKVVARRDSTRAYSSNVSILRRGRSNEGRMRLNWNKQTRALKYLALKMATVEVVIGY